MKGERERGKEKKAGRSEERWDKGEQGGAKGRRERDENGAQKSNNGMT